MGITIFTMISLGILMLLLFYGVQTDSPTNLVLQSLTLDFKHWPLFKQNFRAFQLYTNTKVEIKSLGFGFSLSRKVYKDFEVGLIIIMLNLTLIRQRPKF
jgi:hypothetical protein